MSEPAISPNLSQVFDVLQDEALAAAARGRRLYGPQAKKALTTKFPDFSERSLGFRKFVDLLRAGNDAGRFQLLVEDGHPRIVPAPTTSVRPRLEQGKLKPDLWTAMVTWGTGMRFWDRKRRRALYVPVDDAGDPLWKSSPGDFVEVDPIPMEVQLRWMAEFANDQSEVIQEALLMSLEDPTPGAFKRALTELNLGAAWRTRLRQRVTEHAVEWAAQNEIPAAFIVESEGRANRPVPRPVEPKPSQVAGSVPEAEKLRVKLHQVIDRMTAEELSEMKVPASYLLEL